jgi:phosphate-selective porin OprO/OprP
MFDFVYPKRSVFKGGVGAFEATINASYTDVNSGTIQGGKLWRVSPMLAWYPTYELRLTLGFHGPNPGNALTGKSSPTSNL